MNIDKKVLTKIKPAVRDRDILNPYLQQQDHCETKLCPPWREVLHGRAVPDWLIGHEAAAAAVRGPPLEEGAQGGVPPSCQGSP